jgi:hypothetical protein
VLQRAGLKVTQAETGRSFVASDSRLEERLQRRILSTVIPQLAQGLLDNRKNRLPVAAKPSDEELVEVFRASLVFLYRLLFLFYAESRELLPLIDAGEFSVSFKEVRDGIAEQGGVTTSEVADHFQRSYSETGTSIDDRLSLLFQALAQRQRGLAIPACLSGLFPGAPRSADHSLAEHKISDRRLAIAIDALSRDQSGPASRLAFVDYGALDVRLFGTIHESLLDYRLCLPQGDMEKRIPKRSGRNRGQHRSELSEALGAREVYLASQKKGRKSSGSYYTPPAIVEYLIANTVGPVLDEKLQALRREILAEPEKPHKKRGPSPDVFDRLFDLRVIDPAMGCGHFLVEAVNFVTSRLLEFLSELPADLGHSVFDRALIKRCVLERCIYGVDLDPLAVELAKATLALECGIPGAPFIFPDSHLRCGNSLIGNVAQTESSAPLPEAADSPAFHWHLEFPSVFEDRKATACHGFDCVVGNPPYVRIQNLDDALARQLGHQFETAAGKFDLYIPFLERGTALLRQNGILGMIVPNKMFTAQYGAAFRRFATRHRLLRQVVDFESEQVFPGASTYCCLIFLRRQSGACVSVSRGSVKRPIARETALVSATRFGEAPWNVKPSAAATRTQGVPLKTACRAIFQGLITGADRLLIGKRDGNSIRLGTDCVDFVPDVFRPVLKGSDVRRFALRFSAHYVLYPYRLADGKTELIPEDELAARHPAAYRYLVKHRRELKKRGSPSMAYPAWYAHWCPRNRERFAAPKIVTQVLAARASFAFDRHGTYTFVGGGNAGVYGLIPQFTEEDRLWLLLAILNSRVFDAQVQEKSSRFRGGYFSYARRFIENVLIPPIEELDVRAPLPRQIVTLTKSRAEFPPECHNRLEAEIEAAVAELYRCGTR